MVRFAPVVGLKMQRKLRQLGVMGDYHLLLAHEVLQHRQEYRELYPNRGDVAANPFVVMDNSLIELGQPLDPEGLVAAAYTTHSSALVLPDKLGDPKETVLLSESAAVSLGSRGSYTTLLAVVQGQNFDDMIRCARYLVQIPGVGILSVPRITVKYLGSRLSITEQLSMLFGLPIHLLGFSNNLTDDIRTAKLPGVVGIDSAMPVWLGLKGERLPDDPMEIDFGSRPEGYLDIDPENVDPWLWANIAENVSRVRRWLSPAYGAFD